MRIIFKRYSTAIVKEQLNSIQSFPFAHGFFLARETTNQSESKSPELTSNWEDHENKKTANGDEDLDLNQLMEDIKSYIRSIDVSNL